MEGKTDFTFKKDREDRLHFIGPVEAPIYVCKKKELNDLFSEKFNKCLEVWAYFNAGFGLPGGRSWDQLDPDLANILLAMENHYRDTFSHEVITIKYLEAVINHLKAGFRLK